MDENLNPKLSVEPVYDVDDKPPLHVAIPLGLQHVLAMFAGNVTVPIIIAGVLGLSLPERAFLIQCAMFVAGVTTLLQINRIGPIGSRLPVVQGTSFGFLPTARAIGAQFGLSGILGAAFIGGIFQMFLGFFLKPIRKVFAPIVTGTVLLAIGLSLLPAGINHAAGGAGSATFGSLTNLALAGIVLAVIIFCNQYLKGFASMASILIGIVVGYVLAFPMGVITWETFSAAVGNARWVSFPMPLVHKLTFHWSAIAAMLIMYVVTTVETVGDISGITMGGAGREATDKELSGGVMADGLASSFAALFNALPNTSYSQNVGIISFTGVMSRYVVGIGAIFLIIAGMFPKLGAIIAVMPSSVLGGAAIIMFAMIATSGIVLISQDELNRRNLLVVAVALGLGLGLSQVPGAMVNFPDEVQMIFAGSGIVVSCLIALLLNLILPKDTGREQRKDKAA